MFKILELEQNECNTIARALVALRSKTYDEMHERVKYDKAYAKSCSDYINHINELLTKLNETDRSKN